jgi:hypothetical protein
VEIDVPVFVHNLERPSREDRKDHMLAILKGVGFLQCHNLQMRTQLPVLTRSRRTICCVSSHVILAALDEWPALLCPELCFKSCQNPPSIAYLSHHRAWFGHDPALHGGGGVPTEGRANYPTHHPSAFASIDGMLSRLVREGVLNAFAATLLPFFQDSYGSDVGAAAARPLRYCVS